MKVEGDRSFSAPRAEVWRVLNDPASMAKTMPGVESFEVHDDRRWRANVKIPLGLGGLRMSIDMDKTEEPSSEAGELDDYGPPAESTPEPEPAAGTSGADEGVSPLAPEKYEPEPEGPTTSTEG